MYMMYVCCQESVWGMNAAKRCMLLMRACIVCTGAPTGAPPYGSALIPTSSNNDNNAKCLHGTGMMVALIADLDLLDTHNDTVYSILSHWKPHHWHPDTLMATILSSMYTWTGKWFSWPWKTHLLLCTVPTTPVSQMVLNQWDLSWYSARYNVFYWASIEFSS